MPDRGIELEPLLIEPLPQILTDEKTETTRTPFVLHRDGSVICAINRGLTR